MTGSAQRSPRTGWRTRARRALVVALSGLVALLALELGIRVLSAALYPKVVRTDEQLGWRHVPNASRDMVGEDGAGLTVTTDAHGNRPPFHDPARRTGVARILVLGDSFAEGAQVPADRIFPVLLEQALGDDVEVVNTGVQAWGTVQQYLFLREEGLGFAPDVVLLAVFENDLYDNCSSYHPWLGPRPYARADEARGGVRIVEGLEPAGFEQFLPPLPFRYFLFEHSALFRSLTKNLYQKMLAGELQATQRADSGRLRSEQRLQVFLGVFDRLRQLLRERRVELAVVLIPSRQQVAANRADDYLSIEARCREVGVPCLPLLPALRRSTEHGEQPYFAEDFHWRTAGHRVAAEELAPFLRPLLPRR